MLFFIVWWLLRTPNFLLDCNLCKCCVCPTLDHGRWNLIRDSNKVSITLFLLGFFVDASETRDLAENTFQETLLLNLFLLLHFQPYHMILHHFKVTIKVRASLSLSTAYTLPAGRPIEIMILRGALRLA